MAPVRKIPLSESFLQKIQAHVKLHCEAFASDTVYLDTIGRIPGGRIVAESRGWPIREAFEYFQHLGAGQLKGDSFKVLDRDYFSIDTHRIDVPVSFTVDERIRPELLVMLDVYAQVYDAENRLRFFLNRKLQEKFGPHFVSRLPHRVRERVELEKSRHHFYVFDPRRGDLEFTHLSDLKRIIVANEEFVEGRQIRSVLLQKLDFLNSIRHLSAHNNLIVPAEVTRIRDSCEFIRLITGTETPATTLSPPEAAESQVVSASGYPYTQAHRVPAGGGGDVRSEPTHTEGAAIT